MASKYDATKTLKGAVPILVENSEIVKTWTLKYEFTYEDFTIEYNLGVEVENLGKTDTEFTKSELKSLTDFTHVEPTFERHYENFLAVKAKAEEPAPVSFDQLPD